MDRAEYSTDLTDAEWDILAPLFPLPATTGRPLAWSFREILNSIFYAVRGGQAWRLMPHDLLPWETAYFYHRVWRLQGFWEHLHTTLREQVRVQAGRDPTPSAAIIDRQSTRTTEAGGPRGYDGGKKINGRKRHILVDTVGLVMGVVVHTADIQDRSGAVLLFNSVRNLFPRMKHVWADAGYTGTLGKTLKDALGWTLEIVKHPWSGNLTTWAPVGQPPPPIHVPAGFVVLKRRWVALRTFAWFGKSRRMSRDFETLAATAKTATTQAVKKLIPEAWLKRLGSKGAAQAEQALQSADAQAALKQGDKKAKELPVAIAMAVSLIAVNDGLNAPVSTMLAQLGSLKKKFTWIKAFTNKSLSKTKSSFHLIASDIEIYNSYDVFDAKSPVIKYVTNMFRGDQGQQKQVLAVIAKLSPEDVSALASILTVEPQGLKKVLTQLIWKDVKASTLQTIRGAARKAADGDVSKIILEPSPETGFPDFPTGVVDVDLALRVDGKWMEAIQYYTPTSLSNLDKILDNSIKKADKKLKQSAAQKNIIEVDLKEVMSTDFPAVKLSNNDNYEIVINFKDKTARSTGE